MTTGEALAAGLVANGVDTVFGIPGAHMYDFNDALQRQSNRIRFIQTRHEQGAGYLAYGYAKSSGRVGVYTVVPGPGVLNSGAALCTAYGANTPVLCITGNIMSDLIGRGRGQLHELPDQLATLRGITRWADRIDYPSEAPARLGEAFTRMLSSRQGPAALEAPWDVFGQAGMVGEPLVGQPEPAPVADPVLLERAAALIRKARNPLIMVGGGALHAGAEVAALSERLQAPVTAHRSGKGIVPDDNDYSFSPVAGFDYWKNTDLLIGIGSRLELQYMRWRWLPKGLKVIRIDIDPTEMVRLKPDVGIVADAAAGTAALIEALGSRRAKTSRAAEFAETRARARAAVSVVQPQVGHLDAIRAVLPRDGFFVEEIAQIGFTARIAFPVYGPRQYVTCGYQDNLGFGFNTALGVKVANPDKAVVSVTGDGGFMFGVQELATAVQHGINVVTIVFNNGGFGNVRRDQTQTYGGRLIGCELNNPDFVRLAESFGADGRRANSPEELQKELDAALAADRPAVIEVPLAPGSEASPWPFIHPKAPE